MTVLVLKLTITPTVIASATLAARRFGPAIGGWLIGLPVTAGPVVLFLALEHGSRFASHVATGFVAGVTAQAAFVLGYVGAAVRGGRWLTCLASGTASFALAGSALDLAGPSLATLTVCAVGALALGLVVVPRGEAPRHTPPARYDIPLRMVLATALVIAITAFASTLGPGLSGIVTTYPLLSTLLAVFVHHADGKAAAIAVYRGLLIGLFALMGFAFALTILLSRVSLAPAFTLAVALALTIQLSSLRAVKRPRLSGA